MTELDAKALQRAFAELPPLDKHRGDPAWYVRRRKLRNVIRKRKPMELVMLDAARMGLNPGAVRRIDRDRILDVGISTHMMPLHHIIDYVRPFVESIILIGIQPEPLFGNRSSVDLNLTVFY